MSRVIYTTFGILTVLISCVDADGMLEEPYVVYSTESGYTRCGPGDAFYRTDRLNEGDKLEVYLETDDGWLGIRPPASSFCWIPADQIDANAAHTEGTIAAAECVAWIGTNLGRAKKYRWQVKLDLGEPVTIIGKTSRETATGEVALWYRVVPPPGEFRWIHDSQIVRSKEELAEVKASRSRADEPMIAEASEQEESNQEKPATFQVAEAVRNAERDADGAEDQQEEVAQVSYEPSIPTRPISESELSVDERVRVMEIREGEVATTSASDSPWVSSHRRPVSPVPDSKTVKVGNHQATFQPRNTQSANSAVPSLQDLQMTFARMMALGSPAAQFESLKLQVQSVASQAPSKQTRSTAAGLLVRIEKYQQTLSGTPAATSAGVSEPGPFERKGWLQKVYSERQNAPPYALTNGNGITIAYVSPATGMSFQRYLNQQVGIVGKPDFRKDLSSPHFIAERVVPVRR